MKNLFLTSWLFAVVLSMGTYGAMAQSSATHSWTPKQAKQWLQGGSWRHGLTLNPHASLDAQAFAVQYQLHPTWWDQAFAFLQRPDLATLPAGNYSIVGEEVFASISEYIPKPMEQAGWESHRKFADIQCMLKGEEKIGVAAVAKARVLHPYDPAKDLANYTAKGKYYLASPGTFFIFFPGDAHSPNINPGKEGTVRKVVIKVGVTE